MNVQDSKVKDTIYGELHNNLVINYGIASTGVRLGTLIDLIYDFNVSSSGKIIRMEIDMPPFSS
jgi:hypothetical protein